MSDTPTRKIGSLSKREAQARCYTSCKRCSADAARHHLEQGHSSRCAYATARICGANGKEGTDQRHSSRRSAYTSPCGIPCRRIHKRLREL